jgi:hypothetical protein
MDDGKVKTCQLHFDKSKATYILSQHFYFLDWDKRLDPRHGWLRNQLIVLAEYEEVTFAMPKDYLYRLCGEIVEKLGIGKFSVFFNYYTVNSVSSELPAMCLTGNQVDDISQVAKMLQGVLEYIAENKDSFL